MANTQKLLKRITALLQVDLQDLLMDKDAPPGTPGEAAESDAAHWIAEMEKGLEQAQDAVAAALVQERQLLGKLREAQACSGEWDAKTDAALQAGDEERARVTLRRKLAYDQAAAELQGKLDHHRKTMADMKASVEALQVKIKDARHQYRALR